MKLINLEKILWSLEEEKFEIILDKKIIDGAKNAIERMLAIA